MTESTFVKSWGDFLATHLDEWQALAANLDAAPDLGPLWANALVSVHRVPRKEISVFAAADSAGLALVYPFRLRRMSLPHFHSTMMEPLTNIYCIRSNILSRLSANETLQAIQKLSRQIKSWDIFSINNISVGTEFDSIWSKFKHNGCYRTSTTPGNSPPYLTISGNWEDYLGGKSTNFRYNLRRKRRKLEACGDVEIEFVTSDEDFVRVYEQICKIEKHSWKATEGSAITSRAWESDFYGNILPPLLANGQAIVTLLRVSGKAVAHDISAVGGKTAYCLKTSFDDSYSAESPGMVLRTELLSRLFDQRLTEYDFLGAGESYKLGWSSGVRDTFDAIAYNRSWRGAFAAARNRVQRWARDTLGKGKT